MSPFLTSAQDLVLALVLESRRMHMRRSMADWAFIALSVMFTAAGVFMFALALRQFYQSNMSPELATFVSGAVFMVIGFAGALGVHHFQKRRQTGFDTIHKTIQDTLPDLIKGLGDTMAEPIQQNPKAYVALAALIGFFLARR